MWERRKAGGGAGGEGTWEWGQVMGPGKLELPKGAAPAGCRHSFHPAVQEQTQGFQGKISFQEVQACAEEGGRPLHTQRVRVPSLAGWEAS